MFLTSLGGTAFWITFITGFVLADLANVLQTFWLGYAGSNNLFFRANWLSDIGLHNTKSTQPQKSMSPII